MGNLFRETMLRVQGKDKEYNEQIDKEYKYMKQKSIREKSCMMCKHCFNVETGKDQYFECDINKHKRGYSFTINCEFFERKE